MAEHIDAERISTLLDEPWADHDGQAHLETCADCRAEFERLSRLRMALSALPDERAPRGEWASIQAALDASESPRGGLSIGRRLLVPGPLQAAAALTLFAGGVIAGLQFTTGRPAEAAADLPAAVSPDERAMLDGLNEIESLRTPLRQVGESVPGTGSEAGFQGRDPVETAQSLAKLEGYIRAARDRLDTNPDDPLASAYLLELVELRDRLTEELGRTSGTRTW